VSARTTGLSIVGGRNHVVRGAKCRNQMPHLYFDVTVTVFRIARPGGVHAVVAESVLIKHQLLIVNRPRRRAPNLRVRDRLIAGLCSLWIKPTRLLRVAIVLKPSTLLHFHRCLVRRKYRLLFSPKHRAKPGPKGPSADVKRRRQLEQ